MIGAMVLGAARAAEAVAAVLGRPHAEVAPAVPADAEHDRNGYLAGGASGPVPLGDEPVNAPAPLPGSDPLTRPVDALGPLLFLKRPINGHYRFATKLPCPACGNDCTWLAMRLEAGNRDLTWWDFGGDCGCPATVDLDVLMKPATAAAMKL